MLNKSIFIEQTIHGYVNGHHLIATSVNLSEKSKRKMEILSDLSGPEIQKGFLEYFTGYFLQEDNKVVLSYTWYAEEMERPGCVWTHSLLIEPKDLFLLGENINQVINAFVRPENSLNFTNYTKQIEIKPEINNKIVLDNMKMKYLIWAIWGNNSPSIIILAENSKYYANEIIYLWTRQNRDMQQWFSFSTGSLAIRKFETEILNFQIVPKYTINNIVSRQSEYKVLQEISSIKSFPIWVNKAYEFQIKDSWEDFNQFRNKFGIQYTQSKFLAQFVKIYVGAKAELRCLNVAEGLNIIEKIFPMNEKEKLGNQFVELYISNQLHEWESIDNTLKILVYLVNNTWLSIDLKLLKILINKGLLTDINNSNKLVSYLAKNEIGEVGETILTIYSELISLEMFVDFTNMELDICSLLVTLNPKLAQCIEIWYQPKGFQEEILQCLIMQKQRAVLIDNILTIVLNTSTYDFGKELFNLFGEKAINIFLVYLLGFKTLASQSSETIKEICKNHANDCVNMLEKTYKEMNNQQLLLMFEIIDPYSNSATRIDQDLLISIFDKIEINNLSIEDQMKVALFYFPIILLSSNIFPLYVVKFAFTIIHSSVAKQEFSNYEWAKFERLLPENTWFNQWDKCKRLRKAIRRKGYRLKIIEEISDFEIHLL
ncbi:hypothetical protein [Anaerospora sp.]|uniref:GAP1-N1 domain-containing protein n=1 Tax=Anaerospora sp. TaxID=1960278 RepID=UPI00289A0CF5|nr:hypothetical protein [Anaerospora sp.]